MDGAYMHDFALHAFSYSFKEESVYLSIDNADSNKYLTTLFFLPNSVSPHWIKLSSKECLPKHWSNRKLF